MAAAGGVGKATGAAGVVATEVETAAAAAGAALRRRWGVGLELLLGFLDWRAAMGCKLLIRVLDEVTIS